MWWWWVGRKFLPVLLTAFLLTMFISQLSKYIAAILERGFNSNAFIRNSNLKKDTKTYLYGIWNTNFWQILMIFLLLDFNKTAWFDHPGLLNLGHFWPLFFMEWQINEVAQFLYILPLWVHQLWSLPTTAVELWTDRYQKRGFDWGVLRLRGKARTLLQTFVDTSKLPVSQC